MFKQYTRSISNSTRILKTHRSFTKDKGSTVDRYLPGKPFKQQKEWEKRGVTKDEFFIKKYSFMSDDRKKQLEQKNARQARFKQHKREFEKNRSEQEFPRRRQNRDYEQDYYEEDHEEDIIDKSLYEFVYGKYAVLSALKSNKRQLFDKLYYTSGKETISEILDISKKYGIQIEEASSKSKLDNLTNKGVHNGVVLQTRRLELPTLAKFGDVNGEQGLYELDIWNDVFSSQIKMNKSVIRKEEGSRFPLALYLDEITDPQNVGAIIRTAYFLGVDFIVTPSNNTARLGPATAKAAAGALDLMDLYLVENGLKFMRSVKDSSWSIITSDVKPSSRSIDQSQLSGILDHSPVLLVLGSEGSGVRTNIKNLSDYFVGLSKNRIDNDHIVDSINVSAAASVLIAKLLG